MEKSFQIREFFFIIGEIFFYVKPNLSDFIKPVKWFFEKFLNIDNKNYKNKYFFMKYFKITQLYI